LKQRVKVTGSHAGMLRAVLQMTLSDPRVFAVPSATLAATQQSATATTPERHRVVDVATRRRP
jgi:hypothetical protein